MGDRDHFGIWTTRGTTYARMPLVALIGLIILIIAMAIIIWSLKRKPDLDLYVQQSRDIVGLMPSLVGLTHSSLDPGNRIEVLQNGSFFAPLLRDIAAARESIHLETFIWYDGRLTRQLASLLARKAREGVSVRILVDGSGGRELDGQEREMLERAGAEVAHYHPLRISNLGEINNRDHRKLVVIDGAIGYVGGHGFADEWLGDAENRKRYRDTGLRMRGPVVNRLQGAFTENWIEETGDIPAAERYFPKLAPAGETAAHVAYTSPEGGANAVQVLYYLAIKAARREIIIQNPYLLPDDDAIEALAEAVRRGVKVRIMVPSADATDTPIVQHASHHHYGTLLARGVEIWEYEKTLLHQKVMIVDGIWSCVGSTNFDDRSLQINDEISVGIIDAHIAQQLRAAFHDDLRFARRMQLNEWKQRPVWHKLTDGIAYLGRSQL